MTTSIPTLCLSVAPGHAPTPATTCDLVAGHDGHHEAWTGKTWANERAILDDRHFLLPVEEVKG